MSALRAAQASTATALLLGVLKGYAAWVTGSAAMLGSLADTGLDLIASLVLLLGVHLAAAPADSDHRFGHGKAEALAALFQVAVITLAATGIVYESVHRLGGDHHVSAAGTGIMVSVVAILLTIALVAYQRRVVARTGSLAIRTDSLHYTSDLALNGAVIVGLVLDHYFGVAGADPIFGIIIALWLAWGAWRAASRAIDELMDREWPLEKRQRFLEIAARHPELKGIHDLRTRSSGNQDFVQFHVAVDPAMTIREAHRVMDVVEARLMAEFPGVEVIIHPDPEGHVDHPGDDLREGEAAEQIAAELETKA